jgi:hypothetical protein
MNKTKIDHAALRAAFFAARANEAKRTTEENRKREESFGWSAESFQYATANKTVWA